MESIMTFTINSKAPLSFIRDNAKLGQSTTIYEGTVGDFEPAVIEAFIGYGFRQWVADAYSGALDLACPESEYSDIDANTDDTKANAKARDEIKARKAVWGKANPDKVEAARVSLAKERVELFLSGAVPEGRTAGNSVSHWTFEAAAKAVAAVKSDDKAVKAWVSAFKTAATSIKDTQAAKRETIVSLWDTCPAVLAEKIFELGRKLESADIEAKREAARLAAERTAELAAELGDEFTL